MPYPFPLPPVADAGEAGSFASIHDQCAASTPRPLTAGSYALPNVGLVVHWPDGWTQTGGTADNIVLSTPITWVPTGSTTAMADQARFSVTVVAYGNADQIPQAVPNAISAAAQGGGVGSGLTLAGQTAAAWWELVPPAQPGCVGCPGVPPYPEIMTIGGLVQYPTLDAGGWLNGVEVDLTGTARANAQPAQVFCDMEAMILGVTKGG
jgi:hypothetical protein